MTLKFNPFTNKLDIVGTSGGGGGDVTGPGSSTDNAIVRWNGATGTLIQNSMATLSDTGDIVANSIDLTVPVSVADGGTNISSYTTGDLLYASGSNILSKLAIGSDTQVLTVSGGVPTWSASAGGGVTSVSGTANRITSTGGATPVIDIAATYVGQTSITTLGTIGTGTWQGSLVALAYGGTNANLTASDGGIFYSTAAAGAILAGTATANKVLMSGSSTAPTWSTPTFPNASATSGKFIRSDGTNWIASTPTLPTTAGTSGKVLQSDGTNYIESTPTYPSASGSIGKIIISDGTNNVYSTPTYPNSATGTGTILRANGTNWVASTATYPDTVSAGDAIYGSASNVFSTLSLTGVPGSHMIYDGSNLVAYNPAKHIFLFDDFICNNANGAISWNFTGVNGAAIAQVSLTETIYQGVCEPRISSSAGSAYAYRLGQTDTSNNPILLANQTIYCHFILKMTALSDATDTFKTRIGLFNGGAATDPQTDGVYFEYTHGTNSGNWQMICINNTTGTTANSSTAADTSFHKFSIKINSTATSASFFIDGTELANSPVTTNLPTAKQIYFGIQTVRTAGTTNSKFIRFDQFYAFINLNSAR